jgi:hypothetical protein
MNSIPNHHLDCESIPWLFQDLDSTKIRNCLANVRDPLEITFQLKRESVPYLELQDPDDAPDCLRTSLHYIPVPREIFFVSVEESGAPLCYSSRIDLEKEEVLGIKLPIAKEGVKVVFPLSSPPQTDEELIRLLASWAITPFWSMDEDHPQIISKFVPESICRACFGERDLLRAQEPFLPMWPTGRHDSTDVSN